MKVYTSKVRVENLTDSEKTFVASKLPKKVKYSKHFIERMKERKIFINKTKLNEALTIENLLDIQLTENEVTYLFHTKLSKHLEVLFIVGENGNILTTWKTTKIKQTNKSIYTDNLEKYKKIVC